MTIDYNKVNNVTWTTTTLSDPRETTLDVINQLCDDLENELIRRGYSQPHVIFQAQGCLSAVGFYVTTTAHGKAGSQWRSFHTRVSPSEIHTLIARTQIAIDLECPNKRERLKREFNDAFAKLAQTAEELGEFVPEYSNYAEILRESRRSNLLEDRSHDEPI